MITVINLGQNAGQGTGRHLEEVAAALRTLETVLQNGTAGQTVVVSILKLNRDDQTSSRY